VIRIIEHRQDAQTGEEVFELRVFQSQGLGVRACIVPADLPLNHVMMDDMSEPATEAFLAALTLCEKEAIPNLWIHDPLGLFPPHDRPVREM
jgi:hypothetical protein